MHPCLSLDSLPPALDGDASAWEIAPVSAIVTCDSRNRVVVRDAVPGQKYLVRGLTLEPVVDAPARRKPKEWAGPKKDLDDYLEEMGALGLRVDPIKEKAGPCKF